MGLTSSKIVPAPNSFVIDPDGSAGLVLHVRGGWLLAGQPNWQSVASANITLADDATNYVEVSSTGTLSVNSTSFTASAVFLYEVVVASGVVTAMQDWRSNPNVSPSVGRSLICQGPAKVGTTAGWVVGAANNIGKLATIPQSQTSSTLVVPVTGLIVGETITGFAVNGSIQSAGNTGTLTADLRKITAAAAGGTDASVGAMAAPLSVITNTVVSAANAAKTGLTEVVAAAVSYYVLITASTGATVTEELGSVVVTTTAP